ncbi:hypothetical protein FZC78_07080 [Rossellomorea vietnamensis]|uniref:Uncharacterized protein n=1 Tax=Rossellomorea vietnamensis TaxID=218284 RepID=A0A5D4NUS0_9BACI|nr:CorA family divalent cation transporter [Rossellomorea vietnamensis]TYS17619.1 hypothetical protein FZC78_07080 [Rossellomorea vietnamensis]
MQNNQISWDWIRLDSVSDDRFQYGLGPKFNHKSWFAEHGAHSDHFTLSDEESDGRITMAGSLPITITKELKTEDIHFILTKDRLITAGFSTTLFHWKEPKELHTIMKSCPSPHESFLLLINLVLDRYTMDLYPSFKHIKMLHSRIEGNKTSEHLSQLIDYRHKLIRWENMLLPYEEFLLTLKAAYGDVFSNSKEYIKVEARVQKIFKLIQHYNGTLNKLLNLDNTLVEYRGNEIMKTLTVFTVITTPMTALGALWGMNFKNMPELNEPYGYPLALTFILLSSIVIFIWLHKKGWTQNILEGKKGRDRKN